MHTSQFDDGRIDVPAPDAASDLGCALDLTGFQRDLVVVIAGIGQTRPSGRTIRRALETLWETEVNESRVYQNLTELRERELVASRPIDGRTKGYSVTTRGRSLLETYCAWSEQCLGAESDRPPATGG